MKKTVLALVAFSTLSYSSFSQTELLTNGNFETGDLTGWMASEVNGVDGGGSSCDENWRVEANSSSICCCMTDINPTEGTSAAFTSFDSEVANTEWILEQTVALPAIAVTAANVSFDFAGKFDFIIAGNIITIPREFSVDFYTTGGTFIANIYNDSTIISQDSVIINTSQNIDVLAMLTGLQGTNIVLRFTASIPEAVTGPGKAFIDDVSFMVTEGVSGIKDMLELEGFSYFPNPAQNILNVNSTGNVERVEIYDMLGQRIIHMELSSNNAEINVSDLSSGTYTIKAISKNGETGLYKFTKK